MARGNKSTEAGAKRKTADAPDEEKPSTSDDAASSPPEPSKGDEKGTGSSKAAPTPTDGGKSTEAGAKPPKAKEAPPTIDGASSGAQGGPPPPTEARVVARHPYSVASGRSITSLRGILGPGAEVRAEFLHGGEESLDALVEAGVVVQRS